MIKVKYERYWNDFIRKSEEKTFTNLNALADWIFGQMQQDYTKDSWMTFLDRRSNMNMFAFIQNFLSGYAGRIDLN